MSHNSQAKKLATVLNFGSLSSLSYDDLIKDLDNRFASPSHKSLYTYDDYVEQYKEYGYNGKVCYVFTPYNEYDEDLDKTWHFTTNIFTLIDMIFKQISLL
jgi:hypothetical protein